MKNKKYIIIFGVVVLFVIFIFYFFNKPSKTSNNQIISLIPTSNPSSLPLEASTTTQELPLSGTETSPNKKISSEEPSLEFYKEFDSVINIGDEKYINLFKESQKIVNFPIKYIKSSKGYKLKSIEVWQGNTEGVIATYQNENKTFVLDEGTIFFNVDYMGLPIEIELAKNKKGYWWDIIQEDGNHQRILYFDYLEKDGIDYLYTIKSSDLTKEEMIDIANLIITQE